ncbi:MAG: DUF1440 domain-containing protein [Actinomycetota bacterium]|nr:DUF1440 domain-containing protein [Actinomycetota bacterium]
MGIGQQLLNSGMRGTVAAMAMSGTRRLTTSLGWVHQPPPEAVLQQKAGGLMAKIPKGKHQAATELAHWTMGFVAGVGYGLVPEAVRRFRWAGAAYGLAVLTGFEAVAAPILGLSQAKQARPVERLVFLADHLLYGVVLDPPRHEHS